MYLLYLMDYMTIRRHGDILLLVVLCTMVGSQFQIHPIKNPDGL